MYASEEGTHTFSTPMRRHVEGFGSPSGRTIEMSTTAADRIEQLMPDMAKLPSLDIDRIRKLRLHAAAAQHANVLATAKQDAPRLRRLLEEGGKLRQDLLSTADLLVRSSLSAEREPR